VKFTDVILQTATKVLVFIIMAFSIYILFAGHHDPGGGFIGGLITASAITLLYIALDAETVRQMLPLDFRLVAASGVLLAVLTGTASLFFREPFLNQVFAHVHIPLLGEMELTSAFVFDTGVYLVVVGATLGIISSVSEDR